MIPLSKPSFSKKEFSAVSDVLKSGMLAQGEWVEKFEKEFAEYIGTKYAVATSSGTTALYLALIAAGIKPGDEVITTPFTFIASANSILYAGAKPVFADIDENTFNINPNKIIEKITKKTRAILPVHLFGMSADMKVINKIAKEYKLMVIEDACQAHGAAIGEKKAGSTGVAGCFSFYPTKNMAIGEGGMITTNNKKLADRARLLREHGMKIRYYHQIIGHNFRMTNIEAALGRVQLKKLDLFNSKRVKNATTLSKNLKDIDGIIVPTISEGFSHVFHQYTMRVTKNFPLKREELIELLTRKGIGYGIFYPLPIHRQAAYRKLGFRDSLPVSERVSNEVLSLPIYPGVTKDELQYIISSILSIK